MTTTRASTLTLLVLAVVLCWQSCASTAPPSGLAEDEWEASAPGRMTAIVRHSDGEEMGRVAARLRHEDGAWSPFGRDVVRRSDGEEMRVGVRSWSLSALDGGLLRADNLTPGAYTLQVSGLWRANTYVAFEVRPGEETTLTVTLQPGTLRFLEFPRPDITSWGKVRIEIYDEAGQLTCDLSLVLPERATGITVFWLPGLGTFTYQATTDTGLRAEGAIEVTTLAWDQEPIRIELH